MLAAGCGRGRVQSPLSDMENLWEWKPGKSKESVVKGEDHQGRMQDEMKILCEGLRRSLENF